MLKNKKPVETIEHEINRYIHGSADAKRTILAVYLFGSVLDNEKFKNNSDIDLAFLVDKTSGLKASDILKQFCRKLPKFFP